MNFVCWKHYLFIFILDQLSMYVVRLLYLSAAIQRIDIGRVNTRQNHVINIQYYFFDMNVLHSVLEDIRVQMCRTGNICRGKWRCFLEEWRKQKSNFSCISSLYGTPRSPTHIHKTAHAISHYHHQMVSKACQHAILVLAHSETQLQLTAPTLKANMQMTESAAVNRRFTEVGEEQCSATLCNRQLTGEDKLLSMLKVTGSF